jgi:phage-related protein
VADTALTITVATETAAAVSGFGQVSDAATDMSRDVDKAAQVSVDAGKRLGDGVAGGADAVATKSSAATGALGALSAGFELVGLEAYAGALQGAAMATDFMSGVGESLTLVMELGAVAKAKDAAAAAAHAVASGVSTAATTALSVAQGALNAVMALNPIALVVIALVALVAGLVLAYNKSETFRDIIQTVGRIGREAIGFVVDKMGDLVEFITEKVVPKFTALKDAAVLVWDRITEALEAMKDAIAEKVQALREAVAEKFDAIREKGRDIWDDIKDKVDTVAGLIESAIETMKDVIAGYFTAMFKPIDYLYDKVQDLIGLLGKIPGLPGGDEAVSAGVGGGRTTGGSGVFSGGPGDSSRAPVVVNINFGGVVTDPIGTAREIKAMLARLDLVG